MLYRYTNFLKGEDTFFFVLGFTVWCDAVPRVKYGEESCVWFLGRRNFEKEKESEGPRVLFNLTSEPGKTVLSIAHYWDESSSCNSFLKWSTWKKCDSLVNTYTTSCLRANYLCLFLIIAVDKLERFTRSLLLQLAMVRSLLLRALCALFRCASHFLWWFPVQLSGSFNCNSSGYRGVFAYFGSIFALAVSSSLLIIADLAWGLFSMLYSQGVPWWSVWVG